LNRDQYFKDELYRSIVLSLSQHMTMSSARAFQCFRSHVSSTRPLESEITILIDNDTFHLLLEQELLTSVNLVYK